MLKEADFMDLFLRTDVESLGRLRSRCAPSPQGNEESIIAYLCAPLDISATTLFVDRIANDQPVASFTWRSDGYWVWSNATEYYVRKYHFRVPDEFVLHMRTRDWQPPCDVDRKHLAAELLALWQELENTS